MSEPRNEWGALLGYCPCGNALSIKEMDWNTDGLCDQCINNEADENLVSDDDDEGWIEP